MSKKQTRIFLWVVPRSISTAFFRAMMNRKNIKVVFEPYARAYYLGPDRVSSRYEVGPINGQDTFVINDEDTFENIRGLCEQPYLGADEVFVKDMAYFLVNQLENTAMLPTGYIHTFLIRHPAKTVPSFYRASTNKDISGWDYFDPSGASIKELYQMFELVTKTLRQDAIIVDADDLVAHPEDILRQYCTRVGIEFQQSMVDWEDDPHNHPVFKDWSPGWFTHVLNSRRFEPNAPKPASTPVMSKFPEDVQAAINDNLPYYDKMHAQRIKVMLAKNIS